MFNWIMRFLRSEGLPLPPARIWLQFRYNRHLIDTVKAIPGAKWHGYAGGPKVWSIPADALTSRNPRV